YVGRLAIGRLNAGKVARNQKIFRMGVDGAGNPIRQSFGVTRVYVFDGLEQKEVAEAEAGDIAVIAGNEGAEIGDTFAGSETAQPMTRIRVEKPTLGMLFSVNTSPLSGKEGEAIMSRKLRERLLREVRANVAMSFEETALPDQFRVLGRGELQFAI